MLGQSATRLNLSIGVNLLSNCSMILLDPLCIRVIEASVFVMHLSHLYLGVSGVPLRGASLLPTHREAGSTSLYTVTDPGVQIVPPTPRQSFSEKGASEPLFPSFPLCYH